jgi:hypothetical protein
LTFASDSFSNLNKPLQITKIKRESSKMNFRSMTGPGGILLGIRLMPTVTSLEYNDNQNGTVSASSKLGFGIGGLLGVQVNDHVGVQVEAIYSSLAQKISQDQYKANVKLKYINIPVMLTLNTNYSAPINLNVAVGPQLGINVGSELDVMEGGDSVKANLAVKKSDLGFAYGAGLDFGLSGMKLCVGFRGVIGLFNINDNSRTLQNGEYYILKKTNISTYSAYIGLTFGG